MIKELNDYQNQTGRYASYKRGTREALLYNALQLASEAGEFAGHLAKAYRDDVGFLRPDRKQLMKKELGDIFWSIAQASYELGWTLEDIATTNIEKLESRKVRGTLDGYGDNR